MIDPKLLRQAAADIAVNLARRGFTFDTDENKVLDEKKELEDTK